MTLVGDEQGDNAAGRWAQYLRRRREQRDARSSGQRIERGVAFSICLLAGGAVLLALVFSALSTDWRVFAVALGTFSASATVGGLVGFLFGLPRDAPSQVPGGLRFLFNSNLLKVSDFVTTTIVGLSLTQVGNVIPALEDLANSLRVPLGDHPQSGAFAISLVLSGSAGAIVLAYLWTTVRLREHLERSEMELLQALNSNKALELVMNYIRNDESDINSIRVALAALPRAQVAGIGARVPALTDKADADMLKRANEVKIAIDDYRNDRREAASVLSG